MSKFILCYFITIFATHNRCESTFDNCCNYQSPAVFSSLFVFFCFTENSVTTSRLIKFIQGIVKISPLQSQTRIISIGGEKMVIQHNVKGYEEFTQLVEKLEGSGGPIHVLFSGGKDENGESWCPYCVKAEPVVHDALEKAADKSHFIHVEVGDRPYWKDLNCPFRKDPNTHLVFLPTLLRWKSPQRLDGERVASKDLVEMLFDDEE